MSAQADSKILLLWDLKGQYTDKIFTKYTLATNALYPCTGSIQISLSNVTSFMTSNLTECIIYAFSFLYVEYGINLFKDGDSTNKPAKNGLNFTLS